MKNSILQQNSRYAAQVNDLLAELERHSEQSLNRRPADGGWTALQTVHHLLLAEEGSLRYIRKKLSAPAEFGPVDLSVRARSFLLWAGLNLPIKFKSPPGIDPENLPEQSTLAETHTRWLQIRTDWGVFLEQLPPELSDRAVYRHPRAGRIGWLQMLNFFRQHLKRHRKQIRRALQP